MKARKTLILMVFLWLATDASAHRCDSLPRGSSQLVSVLFHKSFDVFERSHFGGAGIAYALSNGKFSADASGSRIGWLATGGLDYFPGRKDPAEGYDFNYGGYGYAYLGAGLIYLPARFASISLSAGPGAGLYKGNTSFGLHGAGGVSIFVAPRFSVGPSVTWRKQHETAGLWTGAIRVNYIF